MIMAKPASGTPETEQHDQKIERQYGCDFIAELFGDGLILKSLSGVGTNCRRRDNKGNDGNGRSCFL